jgi:hypothetical protein
MRPAVLALSLALAPAQLQAQEKTKLAVLDLTGKGVPADLVENLTDVVTVSLNKLGVFEVVSRADIQRMLAFEQDKQMLGCQSDTSCLAEIGGALGVALLVSGSVGQVGSKYLIQLTLTDTATVTVRAREQREVENADELTGQVEAAARFLVRDLLAMEQGFLILKASEGGADVEIDGRIVGVTPLARQTLSGGPHTVKVVKKGFITWAKDVDIEKNEPAIVDASLVPSLEFIENYDSSANTWRTLAYVAGGVGLAAIGTGVGLWMVNGGRADDYESELIRTNCQEGATIAPTGDCSDLRSDRDSIERLDVIAQAVGWVGAASLAAGIWMFFQGPEPGVYDQYKPQASVTIVPLADGVVAAGSWRF